METPGNLTPPGEPVVGHDRPILALAFSADGRSLAVSGGGLIPGASSVRVIDVETRSVRRICHGHVMGVFDLAYDPRTGLLASASHDYSVLLWEVDDRNDAIFLVGDADADISRHCVGFAGNRVLIGDGETFAGEHASLTSVDLDDGSTHTLIELDHDRRLGIAVLDLLPGGEAIVAVIDHMRDSDVSSEVRIVGVDGTEIARWSPAATIRDVVATERDSLVALVHAESEEDDGVTELVVFDAISGARRANRPVPGAEFGSLAASADRSAVVVAYEHVVESFRAADLEPGFRFDLNADKALSVAWSPKDAVAVGTLARTVRMFDVVRKIERL
jgi:WD40 repeat protein